jgi:hypothetical protein
MERGGKQVKGETTQRCITMNEGERRFMNSYIMCVRILSKQARVASQSNTYIVSVFVKDCWHSKCELANGKIENTEKRGKNQKITARPT